MQHYNPSIGEDLHRIFNLKGQSPTAEVEDYIQPVITIERPIEIIGSSSKNTSGNATISTMPTDKDTYITGFVYSFSKNATCDVATGNCAVEVYINGVTRNLVTLAITTLIEENGQVAINFDKPMKIDRGRLIQHSNTTYAAGSMCRNITIYGYYVETIKGV